MKSRFYTMAAMSCLGMAAMVSSCSQKEEHVNPFFTEYSTPYEIPPFEQITADDYLPALRAGIVQHNAEIDSIVNNPDTPTFENTILAMEKAGNLINKVSIVFFALTESDSSDELVAVAEEFEPMLSQHSDSVSMNPALFARVKYLYDNLDSLNLDTPRRRAVEKRYQSFTRNGALLNDEDKARLMEINTQLTGLYQQYNKNLLSATNEFQIVVDDESRLGGLPQSNIDVAAEEAANAGMPGKWLFTLHAPSRLPVLQYADDRELRREMYEGYTSLASEGKYDNGPVINKILHLRAQKAKLLGYDTFGDYMTANVMAGSVKNAEDLLMQIWKPAVAKVQEEVAEMQAVVDAENGGFTIEPYDYYYYAEKVRKQKYDLDENEVRQYFAVDSVRKGIFTMAKRLYGVNFTEMPDAPKYNPEVKVYDVTDNDGNHVAVFMTDYFPRASKRQGAWMSEFKGAYVDEDGTDVRPIIFNVGNFSRPVGDTPALLTLDEVETMFHEFGHGLHGMLTRVALRSQAGTNVDRDFVELPSQIHEHWALEPELLKEYARSYKTGEVIPDALIEKLNAASTHNMGFTTTELAGAALLDLQYGKLTPAEGDSIDVKAFENEVSAKLGKPAQVQYRYRSPYFKHVFGSDGYASGYYTYLWAEVLDTDGFELFREKGVFDPETAQSFKKNVLEAGGSEDPMILYRRFRGQDPTPAALLRNRGLAK
ncbi:MAG: M3 family metallopeptidase [Muribaculaceae bacterium]|nr:M3 family metallopeptidase [Muribaculaceae bacterium]